jgi:hypothetical protein
MRRVQRSVSLTGTYTYLKSDFVRYCDTREDFVLTFVYRCVKASRKTMENAKRMHS